LLAKAPNGNPILNVFTQQPEPVQVFSIIQELGFTREKTGNFDELFK
jgi:hypothetical protein